MIRALAENVDLLVAARDGADRRHPGRQRVSTAGFRAALTRGIRDHAERTGQGKRAAAVTQDDVMIGVFTHAKP